MTLILGFSLALLAQPSGAKIQNEEAKLQPGDGAASDLFGWTVAISGDTALIASIYDDDNGLNSGSAYVFVRDGGLWTQQAKLVASDGVARDYFGTAVSVSGDTAVIGATPDQEFGTGDNSAYVFARDGETWTQEAKLQLNETPAITRFGAAVSVSGTTAVIGAPGDDGNGLRSGSAYVFARYDGVWTEQAKLLPNDGATGDGFGFSVSLAGDTAIVGARWDDDMGPDTGSVYVFVRDGESWTQQAKLLPNDRVPIVRFGQAVSIAGNTTLIGAAGEVAAMSRGAAYVFVRSGDLWTQQAILLASDGAPFDHFGLDVSISGNTAVVGAIFDDDQGSNSGGAYVFTRSGDVWTEQIKLLPSDGAERDWFGWSVAVTSSTALVSTLQFDDSGSESGAAYLFPVSMIFADGLETGDCSAWSFEVPEP